VNNEKYKILYYIILELIFNEYERKSHKAHPRDWRGLLEE
jgi:hypothetical protein